MKKDIVTDVTFLEQKSTDVGFFESFKIIKDLEDTLKECPNGIGLSAVQIGKLKRVSIIRFPGFKLNLINANIIEYFNLIPFHREGCLSFPDLYIDTKRYKWIKLNNGQIYTGIRAIIIQHELDHQNGKTILDWLDKDFYISPVRET